MSFHLVPHMPTLVILKIMSISLNVPTSPQSPCESCRPCSRTSTYYSIRSLPPLLEHVVHYFPTSTDHVVTIYQIWQITLFTRVCCSQFATINRPLFTVHCLQPSRIHPAHSLPFYTNHLVHKPAYSIHDCLPIVNSLPSYVHSS